VELHHRRLSSAQQLSRAAAFAALVDRAQACRDCPRMEGRRRVLGPANGPQSARLIVVGTAPGRLGAERTGIPFSGDRSGAGLDALLVRAGLQRDQVFITNAVLCNPQDRRGRNATPSASELRRCRRHLAGTLALVDAPVVVTLGATALAAVAAVGGERLRFPDCLGAARRWSVQGLPERLLVATYHCGPRVTAHPARRAALLAQWDVVAAATRCTA